MKRINNFQIGVDQNELMLFSDFENGGEMWSGNGPRQRRVPVKFSAAYHSEPSVHISMSLMDIATGPAIRTDISAEKVTKTGFDVVFRTWGDSRIARIRVSWMAIGPLEHDDGWELY
jgi:H-type lectin domain-containing protein